jgi:hypothetical protein
MKLCICCFGLFHRPKRNELKMTPKKSNKKIIKYHINENNTSKTIFNNRNSIFQNINQINNLTLNINSINKENSNNNNQKRFNFPLKTKNSQTPKFESLYDLKDTFRCLFCGGTKCPCEDYRKNPKNAIEGLNCDIINNEIYASQRPSNTLIEKYNLVKRFHKNNIGLIVNLQRPGEHPYCGPNALDPLSGYSYSPSIFSSEGIKVKLSGWKDMDVPDSLYFMLDIIKEIYDMIKIKKKKVLVHCHAGNGRTGIVIACYLMYTYNYNAEEAVFKLREIRKKCIEKNSQMNYCFKFKSFIDQLRRVFTFEKYDVNYFIKHQCDLGIDDMNKNVFIPKIIWLCLDVIHNLKYKNKCNNNNNFIYKGLNGSYDLNDNDYKEIIKIVDEINDDNWESLQNNNKIFIISEIFYNWLGESVTYCISPKRVNEMFNDSNFKFEINEVNKGNHNENLIKSIIKHIKNYLKKVEYKILKYVANFLTSIYPKDNKDNIIEYKGMVEKMSIYLLGFDIDLLIYFKTNYEKNQINEEIEHNLSIEFEISIKECIEAIDNFLILIEFLKNKIQLSIRKSMTNTINLSNKKMFSKKLNFEKLNQKYKSVISFNNPSSNENSIYLFNSPSSTRNKNKLNLSILDRVNKNKIKKTNSPLKKHLLDIVQNKDKKNKQKNIFDFSNIKQRNTLKSVNHKSKYLFEQKTNLNDSNSILKNDQNEQVPIIRINYVQKENNFE